MRHAFLKPNIVPEPLFASWYAWPHLVSPATAAMNVLERHVQIMRSYLQAPQIHAAAVKNPSMLGGPFMDYVGNRSEHVRALLQRTQEQQAPLIAFAQAVQELSRMLRDNARGYSLEPLYAKVPEILKGYVELVYDLSHQPSFRFFEALLYRSPFYDLASQSVAFSIIDEDVRPFVLSTPKLDDLGVLRLPLSFADSRIDDLYRMQRCAGDVEEMRERLAVPADKADLFRSFFTDQPPKPHGAYTGDGIRTRYFGHACILVESKDFSILSDPVISYNYPSDVSRYTYSELPDRIDYVIITHNHQDHVLLETLLQLRHRIDKIIVPRGGGGSLQDPSLKLMLEAIGFTGVVELGELEQIKLPGCTITGLPFLGEHSDLDIRTKLCHHIRLADFSLLFAADSCNIEPKLYEHVQREVGEIDILFLGMECAGAPLSWLYGPLLPEPAPRDKDHSRRLSGCDYERALELVNRFSPKDVYVYAMGQEPWLNYIMSLKYTETSKPIVESNKLLEACRERGIVAERLFGEKEIIYV